MEHMPSIKSVMTPFPYSVDASEEISRAKEMMAKHGIRHLPVVKDGALVGVVSADDIQHRIDVAGSDTPLVGDVHLADVHIVALSAPVDRVLREMVSRHLEAALVVKGDKLAGIFTITDALRSFAEFLCSIFPTRNPEDAA